jgi:hypothetical protein
VEVEVEEEEEGQEEEEEEEEGEEGYRMGASIPGSQGDRWQLEYSHLHYHNHVITFPADSLLCGSPIMVSTNPQGGR